MGSQENCSWHFAEGKWWEIAHFSAMIFSLRGMCGEMCGYWAMGIMFILLLVLELYLYNNDKRTGSAGNKSDWFNNKSGWFNK